MAKKQATEKPITLKVDERPLTPSQTEAVEYLHTKYQDGGRPFIVWYGGVRAGKTEGAVRCLYDHLALIDTPNPLYIIGGVTARSVLTNLGAYIKDTGKVRGYKVKEYRGVAFPRWEITTPNGVATLAIYGGSKHGDDAKVQGSTADGLLLDEFELLNRLFVKQCEARISQAGALRIYTANKGGPYTWATKDYYNKAIKGDLDCLFLDVPTQDNNFLDAGFIAEKMAEYDEELINRFIKNEHTLAFRPVYKPSQNPPSDGDNIADLLCVHAWGSDTMALRFAKLNDQWTITHALDYQPPVNPDSLAPAHVYLVNSTAPLLSRGLSRRRPRVNVRNYDDAMYPHQVELSQRAFAAGKVKVSEDAAELLEALELYNTPGVYVSPLVKCVEAGIEYLNRRERWFNVNIS